MVDRAAAGQGRERLGINANFASTPDKRAARFALQSAARQLLPGERVSKCLRVPVGRPEIWHSPMSGKAHYKKLITCGSVWTCPVCASKITERRRVELAGALAVWSGSVFMATFTFQHTRDDKLAELVEYLVESFRVVKSGRWWVGVEKQYELVGSVKGFENTHSDAAGWHPHIHVLFFSRLAADKVDTAGLESELSARFAAIMAEAGRYVSGVYGVRVDRAVNAQDQDNQALKNYVNKAWGLDAEMAKASIKTAREVNGVKHYSAWQLLALAGEGDKRAGALFVEYAAAMKGRSSLRWSRGLRKVLGLAREKDDSEVAEETTSAGDVLLAQLDLKQWAVVLANDARAELLRVADRGDASLVWSFLARLGAVVEDRQFSNLVWV